MSIPPSKPVAIILFAQEQEDVARALTDYLREKNIDVLLTNVSKRPNLENYDLYLANIKLGNVFFVIIYSSDYAVSSVFPNVQNIEDMQILMLQEKERFLILSMGLSDVPEIYYDINRIDYRRMENEDDQRRIFGNVENLIFQYFDDYCQRAQANSDEITRYLRTEWAKIISRRDERPLSVKSRSQINMFGWLAVCGHSGDNLNPLISASHIYSIICKTFKISKINPGDKTNFKVIMLCDIDELVSHLCTIRYLISCYLVAHGVVEFDKELATAMLDGMIQEDDQSDQHARRIMQISDDLLRDLSPKEAIKLSLEFLKRLGSFAKGQNVDSDIIIAEELKRRRQHADNSESSNISVNNIVTHKIVFLIKDEQGTYYRIMTIIRQEDPPFNVIRSISETLVPDRVASIQLDVCAKNIAIGRYIETLIGDNKILKDLIYSVKTNTL